MQQQQQQYQTIKNISSISRLPDFCQKDAHSISVKRMEGGEVVPTLRFYQEQYSNIKLLPAVYCTQYLIFTLDTLSHFQALYINSMFIWRRQQSGFNRSLLSLSSSWGAHVFLQDISWLLIKMLLIVNNLKKTTHILGLQLTTRHQYQYTEKIIEDISVWNLVVWVSWSIVYQIVS